VNDPVRLEREADAMIIPVLWNAAKEMAIEAAYCVIVVAGAFVFACLTAALMLPVWLRRLDI
jgi:hypothetical protein